LGSTVEDVQLIVLPLFHSMAQTVMMNSGLYAGATSVLLPRSDPRSGLGGNGRREGDHFRRHADHVLGAIQHYGGHGKDLKIPAEGLMMGTT
jgi:acyl-CoA synthetase (AMP-forming)/AMP-acid ligase II